MVIANVAIVRGDNLNKFEMQNYEPLANQFDLTCYTTYNNNFENINEITLDVKKLHTIGELFKFNRYISNLSNTVLYKIGLIQYMFGLEKELEDKDIVHTAEIRTGYSYQAIKIKIKKNNNVNIVNTIWENIPYVSWKFMSLKYISFNENIKNKIIKFTDKFIAVSNRAKEALILEGVPKNKITVIPMGVDTNRFKPRKKPKELENKLNIPSDNLTILFVGRLTWEKGIYYLIYAIKKLINKFNNINLLMVGDGPEKARLKKIISKLELSSYITIVGSVPYKNIHKYYNLADIFILPSIPTIGWQEQLGMVLIEAMASGLPIVASRSGSIPEVVKDVGVLINPADFLEIYEALEVLLLNENLRNELGMKARKLAENKYNACDISNKIKKVYLNLLQCNI